MLHRRRRGMRILRGEPTVDGHGCCRRRLGYCGGPPGRNSTGGERKAARIAPNCSAARRNSLYVLANHWACTRPSRQVMPQLQGLVDAGNTVGGGEHELRCRRARTGWSMCGPGARRAGGRIVARTTRDVPGTRPVAPRLPAPRLGERASPHHQLHDHAVRGWWGWTMNTICAAAQL